MIPSSAKHWLYMLHQTYKHTILTLCLDQIHNQLTGQMEYYIRESHVLLAMFLLFFFLPLALFGFGIGSDGSLKCVLWKDKQDAALCYVVDQCVCVVYMCM